MLLARRVVADGALVPNGVDRRVAREAELGEDAGPYAVDAGVVVEPEAHQVEEPVRTDRRPVAVHFDDEITFASGESRTKYGWGLGAPLRVLGIAENVPIAVLGGRDPASQYDGVG